MSAVLWAGVIVCLCAVCVMFGLRKVRRSGANEGDTIRGGCVVVIHVRGMSGVACVMCLKMCMHTRACVPTDGGTAGGRGRREGGGRCAP